jgi:hypothetical protein
VKAIRAISVDKELKSEFGYTLLKFACLFKSGI